ncbi:WXG100 family type VII secretion target [Microbacterium enclense]|uniref:WXG100 family type VII secretion target n=1 Tax=Microbacterium enclense TaxID=993073 RepID=UPI0021A4F6A0|nr:WXG100 family type VII secretion target [Microbacterium enclense]MCT2085063.1 WXG100 family type VII secretion target [Microbacterium enclense]
MGTTDLFVPGYPHGTVEGFDGGCRGGACPAADEHGLSCKRAKTLSRSDIRYNRLVKAGRTPAEIAAIIDHGEPENGADVITAATLTSVTLTPTGLGTVELEPEIIVADEPAPEKPAAVYAGAAVTVPTNPAPVDAAAREELTSTAEGRAKIREWGRAQGFVLGVKGKLPGGVVAAYLRAHGLTVPEAAPAEPVTPEEFSEALEQTRERIDDAPAVVAPEVGGTEEIDPEVGARAWVRYDDGVGVVREVKRDDDGIATHVRVSYLPDPRDLEAWETLDWLDRVTDLLPVQQFTYDRFGTGDIYEELERWENEGRVWITADTIAAAKLAAAPAIVADERPDWSDVTIPEDIRAARTTAARLEEDNARLTAELTEAEADFNALQARYEQAQSALELTIRKWDQAQQRAADALTVLGRIASAHIVVLRDRERLQREAAARAAADAAAHEEQERRRREFAVAARYTPLTVLEPAARHAAGPTSWIARILGRR